MSKKKKQFRDIKPHTLGNARRLRREMTPAEKMLWSVLRNRQLGGYKFRRQHPIDNFIVDFYCAEADLVIEIDGDIHTLPDRKKQDLARSAQIENLGFRVIRFTNDEVIRNLEGVAERLLEIIQEIN